VQGLADVVHKLWHTLRSGGLGGRAESIDEVRLANKLLDTNEIANLRQRALSLIDYHKNHKPVLHRQHGEHPSPRRGYGLDYEESRVYQPGDELRFMNWRLTARTGEPYVKVFREERRPSVFILLDQRNSMRFGTRVRLKVTQAVRVAILLAFYNQYCGRSVSGLIVDEGLQWLDTSIDEQSTLGLVSRMNQACPPRALNGEEPDISGIFRALHSALTPGTRVYVLSDFFDLNRDCDSVLAQLAAEHEFSAIHIVDPAEQQLPKAGKLRLSASTLGQARQVDSANPYISQQYHNAAQQHLAGRETQLRSLGIGYVRVPSTTESFENDLVFI